MAKPFSKVTVLTCIPSSNERFPVAPRPGQPLEPSLFWMLAILMVMENCLIAVLCYNSLLKYDVEHLFSRVLCHFDCSDHLHF